MRRMIAIFIALLAAWLGFSSSATSADAAVHGPGTPTIGNRIVLAVTAFTYDYDRAHLTSARSLSPAIGPELQAGSALREVPRSGASDTVSCFAAEAGGAASVRLGQAGEAAVRGAYDIGPKATAQIGGRTRIFDGLNAEAVSEVKNVASQAYTQH